MSISAPRWDLSNVYPSLDSNEFKAAVEDYKKKVAALEKFFKNKFSKAGPKTKASELAPLVGKAIDQINTIQSLSATIVPFIYSYVTTDSRDKLAMKTLSEFEQASLPMSQLLTQFTAWVGKLASKLDPVVKADKTAKAHEFMVFSWKYSLFYRKYKRASRTGKPAFASGYVVHILIRGLSNKCRTS